MQPDARHATKEVKLRKRTQFAKCDPGVRSTSYPAWEMRFAKRTQFGPAPVSEGTRKDADPAAPDATSCNVVQPHATGCNRVQPNREFCKTNPLPARICDGSENK